MNEYNELENLMYAIGGQLYEKDIILYDLFDDKFNHSYVNFSYCSSETDKIKQYEIINKLKKDFTLEELIKKAMMQSDYYRLYQLKWLISNYDEKIKKYNPSAKPILKEGIFSKTFRTRIEELKKLNLDSWRKSNDKVLHSHYYYWINNLLEKEDYSLWAFQCGFSGSRIWDTFHLCNFGDKRLAKIILQYILDNNIISDQTDSKFELELVSPFVQRKGYNVYKVSASGNMGGFWYKVYLTAKELQEIYRTIGSVKIKRFGVAPFFRYVNALKDDNELDTKFYLYFEQ